MWTVLLGVNRRVLLLSLHLFQPPAFIHLFDMGNVLPRCDVATTLIKALAVSYIAAVDDYVRDIVRHTVTFTFCTARTTSYSL